MPAPYTCSRLNDKYMAAKNILAMAVRMTVNEEGGLTERNAPSNDKFN